MLRQTIDVVSHTKVFFMVHFFSANLLIKIFRIIFRGLKDNKAISFVSPEYYGSLSYLVVANFREGGPRVKINVISILGLEFILPH